MATACTICEPTALDRLIRADPVAQPSPYTIEALEPTEADLLTLAPPERYRAFLNEYSAIVERIPIHHAASYLGISHVSLSRIRARMGMANQGRAV